MGNWISSGHRKHIIEDHTALYIVIVKKDKWGREDDFQLKSVKLPKSTPHSAYCLYSDLKKALPAPKLVFTLMKPWGIHAQALSVRAISFAVHCLPFSS